MFSSPSSDRKRGISEVATSPAAPPALVVPGQSFVVVTESMRVEATLGPVLVNKYAECGKQQLTKAWDAVDKEEDELSGEKRDCAKESDENRQHLSKLNLKKDWLQEQLQGVNENIDTVERLESANQRKLRQILYKEELARMKKVAIRWMRSFSKSKPYARNALIFTRDDLKIEHEGLVRAMTEERCFRVLRRMSNLGLGEHESFTESYVRTGKAEGEGVRDLQDRIIEYAKVPTIAQDEEATRLQEEIEALQNRLEAVKNGSAAKKQRTA